MIALLQRVAHARVDVAGITIARIERGLLVFYALFGIPLGRLADLWVRTRLIALGLSVWSVMTPRQKPVA